MRPYTLVHYAVCTRKYTRTRTSINVSKLATNLGMKKVSAGLLQKKKEGDVNMDLCSYMNMDLPVHLHA